MDKRQQKKNQRVATAALHYDDCPCPDLWEGKIDHPTTSVGIYPENFSKSRQEVAKARRRSAYVWPLNVRFGWNSGHVDLSFLSVWPPAHALGRRHAAVAFSPSATLCLGLARLRRESRLRHWSHCGVRWRFGYLGRNMPCMAAARAGSTGAVTASAMATGAKTIATGSASATIGWAGGGVSGSIAAAPPATFADAACWRLA